VLSSAALWLHAAAAATSAQLLQWMLTAAAAAVVHHCKTSARKQYTFQQRSTQCAQGLLALVHSGFLVFFMQLNFGSMFFGEALTKHVAIFNNSPSEARFDLSYGSTADMKAIAGADKADGDDSPHAIFLQMARVRVRTAAAARPSLSMCLSADTLA
jgi:hypothetical protein